MRLSIVALSLGLAVTCLGGCKVPPENDPHNLPYIVFPSNSPDVLQYSTNPYTGAAAPPLYGPPGGRD